MTARTRSDSMAVAREVADAVLYEGYLLYPYRADSRKNQSRWQFGVLGPPGAAEAGVGEDPRLAAQCLLHASAHSTVSVTLRFLHLQRRHVQKWDGTAFTDVAELREGTRSWLSWDEAVEQQFDTGALALRATRKVVEVDGAREVEPLHNTAGELIGQITRVRAPLRAEVELTCTERGGGLWRLGVQVRNTDTGDRPTKDTAITRSLIGAHLLLSCAGAEFVSLLEPPPEAEAAAAACERHRCFPVLAGHPEEKTIMLVSPIILYDYPEVAGESKGALFDSTEIDEILTLRILTLTEEEKAQARATDPLAAQIIDRCDTMTPQELQELHGILRNPHLDEPFGSSPGGLTDSDLAAIPTFTDGDEAKPWWDPASDNAVHPDTAEVLIKGVRVSKGSLVRVHPVRSADAQDLFFAGKTARVAQVQSDVDGNTHVGVVLVDDPAADLHDWYGRYLYFGPEELEPLP